MAGDDTRRTRKGPKEPLRHVGVDAIAAVSDAWPLRAGDNATGRDLARSTGLVHQIRPPRPGYPPVVHTGIVRTPWVSARLTSGRGVQDIGLAVKAREDQPAADQLRGRDDVRVGDAPGDLPVRLHGERLDLGLEEHVGETR